MGAYTFTKFTIAVLSWNIVTARILPFSSYLLLIKVRCDLFTRIATPFFLFKLFFAELKADSNGAHSLCHFGSSTVQLRVS